MCPFHKSLSPWTRANADICPNQINALAYIRSIKMLSRMLASFFYNKKVIIMEQFSKEREEMSIRGSMVNSCNPLLHPLKP